MFGKSKFKINVFVYKLIYNYSSFELQIDLENYDTRLIELDSCGESERTVFIMPPEMTDLPTDSLYSYKVKYNLY